MWGICLYCRISERICNSVPNDNFAPEREAIFYAAGPSFKQNVELPVMANVNLYLIIARLLNLQPALTDGDSAVVSTLFRKSE